MRRSLTLAFALVSASACASVNKPGRDEPVPPPSHPGDSTRAAAPSANEPAREEGHKLVTFSDPARWDQPAPSIYRNGDGRPGPGYWQQRADYDIDATLDTAAKRVSGSVTVHYRNNSPDTLRFVWMQVDQNLFKPGSKGTSIMEIFPIETGPTLGYTLDDVRVNGTPVTPHIDDTMMRLSLPHALMPKGDSITITMKFSFGVPVDGSARFGRDGPDYALAQWYPRMAVYDDVRGWNTDPYLGAGEFYLEYGDFNYNITVPAGYVMAGTGLIQNQAEVLTADQRARLAHAAKTDSTVAIITKDEAAKNLATKVAGTKTWKFRATNVRDVAWAAGPAFRWDATSWDGILCHALYPDQAGPLWQEVAKQTCFSIKDHSRWMKYPYPQATTVTVNVPGGMEYPMFVVDEYEDPSRPGDVFTTTAHEHGHEWFPMIVGSNERRYGWMDEGINTYIDMFPSERWFGTNWDKWPAQGDVYHWSGQFSDWKQAVAHDADLPPMTMPDAFPSPAAWGVAEYAKPATVLLALRNHVLPQGVMDDALREYVRRWAYKHPTPGDFFHTIENVSGQDLTWFWQEFFYTNETLDIAVDSVSVGADSGGANLAAIFVHRNTSATFPLEVRLQLTNGKTFDVKAPEQVWTTGLNKTYFVARVPAPVSGARLWPTGGVPDFDPANDVWGHAPPALPEQPATMDATP